MSSPTDRPPFGIDDPDTSVEAGGFAIEDEATIDTGSIPPGALLDGDATVDRPPSFPPPPDLPRARAGALRSPAEIAALVEEGRPLVEPAARRVLHEVGQRADFDELCSVGRFALVEAARHFDESLSRFGPYATQRLRWAMIDQVRRDTQRRGSASQATALAVAERITRSFRDTQNDELPGDETARVALADALSTHADALAVGLVLAKAREAEISPESTMNPERAVGDLRNVERLRTALAALPDRQRALVERHYLHDERFDHIAESLGISKSWASRLHAQAITSLAEALRSR